jgi:phosphatidylserine/phosphatidylglycerophosphate/cardiolipin synthase-like enzyme
MATERKTGEAWFARSAGHSTPRYGWALLRRDAVAGLTVATVAVPQAMAYALLAGADLAALCGALRSSRLHGPFSGVSLQRYCPPAQAREVASCLQRLHDEGMKPQHLALLAESVLRGRTRAPQQADVVDLVWTGPETLGVTNRDTGVVVRELFGSAEREVLVAGFAVYQGRSIFKRLAERMEERPGLRVRLFLEVQRHPTDTSLPEELVRRFAERFRNQEWPGAKLPELYYDPRSLDREAAKRSSLHAKCVVIDRRVALVTSANFTEAAQTRNIEVGALIQSAWFAMQLAGHFGVRADAGALKRCD